MTLKDLITHFDSTIKWFVYDCENWNLIWWGTGNRNSCPWEMEIITISVVNKGIKIYAKPIDKLLKV